MKLFDPHLKENLLTIGFSGAEAEVYLHLNKEGAQSIQDIVRATKIPRSSVHLAIETMLTKGIVRFFVRGKRKNYTMTEPETLAYILIPEERKIQEKKRKIAHLIPFLRAKSYLKEGSDSRVQILSGEDGLQKLFEMTLQCRHKEILRISVASEKFSFIPDYLQKYVIKRNGKGIRSKLLVPKTSFTKALQKERDAHVREICFLDRTLFDPDCMITLWDDKVAFTSWDKSLKTVLMEGASYADILRSMFFILWDLAEK